MIVPQLDIHGEMLMAQYHERLPIYNLLAQRAYGLLCQALQKQGLYVTAIEHRVKTERSLAGKLELKGAKYQSIDNVTDILGLRIITFYADDVDKVAVIVKQIFQVDWEASVDKRKHQVDSFGYNSLHYICRLSDKSVGENDPELLGQIRFEIQMRTALQHVWSTIEHDLGYKGEVKIPPEYKRQFGRLAGMLELVDDEFSRLRTTLTDYRRQMQQLVESGHLSEVALNYDSFRSYLEMRPFDRLNQRIAAINQAEVFPSPLMPFLLVLQSFGLETLGDVQQMIDEHSDDAYKLAITQLATTDLDILSENVGPQNLCCVYVLKHGGGQPGLKLIFDKLNGSRPANQKTAESIMQTAQTLPFMNR